HESCPVAQWTEVGGEPFPLLGHLCEIGLWKQLATHEGSEKPQLVGRRRDDASIGRTGGQGGWDLESPSSAQHGCDLVVAVEILPSEMPRVLQVERTHDAAPNAVDEGHARARLDDSSEDLVVGV